MRDGYWKIFFNAASLSSLIMLMACQGFGNPFSEKETILPGERKSVLGANSLGDKETKGTHKNAIISKAHALAEWSQPGGNAHHNPGHVALSGSSKWRVRAAQTSRKGFRVTASPLVYQGRIYLYDPLGNVTAHALSGGARIWHTSLKPENEKVAPGGGIAAGAGRIYAATGFSQVVSLDASNGTIGWTKELSSPARSAPTYANGHIYVITAQNTLYALSADDGKELWTFRGIPETAGVLTSASPAVLGNIVVAAYSSGEIVALDAKNGTEKWLDNVAGGSRRAAISGLNDISAHPVIDSGQVYATGVGGRMIAVDVRSGRRLWEANAGSLYTPAVSGNAIFMSDLDGRLLALSKKDGTLLWVTELPKSKKRQVWAGPVLAGGSLWLLSNQGNLVTVNAVSGAISETKKYGSPVYLQPIAAAGRIIAVTADGSLAVIN